MLQEYMRQSKSTGCSYSDYLFLYNYIREYKPMEVLECGTGVSTIVMAYAMLENERDGGATGRLTSMEEIKEWHTIAVEILPPNLKRFTDIVLSPVIEGQYGFFRGMRYKNLPQRPYEFVFVDGPKTHSPKDGMKTFDFDFIWVVENSSKPVYGILDLRLSTFYVLREIFGKEKARFDILRSLGFIGPCSKDDLRSTNEIVVSHKSEF